MVCTATLTENGNDIYSVNFHSSEVSLKKKSIYIYRN